MKTFLLAICSCALLATRLPAEPNRPSVAEIRSACANREAGRRFEVTGHVILPPTRPRLPVHLLTSEGVFHFYDTRTNRTLQPVLGDLVRVTGVTQPSGDRETSNPNGYTLERLANGHLPDLKPVSVGDYLAGDYNNRLVAVRGIVTDVHADDLDRLSYYVVLEGEGHTVCLSVYGEPDTLSDFYPLRGSDVVATGVGDETMRAPKYMGKTLQIAGTNALVVLSRNRVGTAEIPDADPNEDLRVGTKSGLRKVSGVVIARWQENTLLVKTPRCGVVRAELALPPYPENGASVEVTGTPETDLFDLILARAFWRPTAPCAVEPDAPRPIALAALFTNRKGYPTIGVAEHGRLLVTRGVVKSILNENRFILADGDRTILVDCSALPETLESLEEQSRVEITGVCVRESEAWRPSAVFPRVHGLILVPRRPTDIKTLSRPSWWTPVRFRYAILFLVVALAGILVWNAVLRLVVIRKSRILLREQAEKLTETLKIDERTRLAAELHDYHSQNLTAIAYQISAARKTCATDAAETLHRLTTAVRMLKSTRTDLRRCLWDLRNDTLDERDFSLAIRRTVQPVVGAAELSVRFAGQRAQISDSTAHGVLSVLRELAANAANHGQARKIRIAGECRQQVLRFSIADDGVGFDPLNRVGQADGHFGLDGIIDRMKRIGGNVEIESAPDRGTYIRLIINRTPQEPSK